MADPLSIIASAITVGATAAQLSLALFNITQTVKNAPEEIAEIAEEISTLSASLTVLGEVLQWHQNICKPELFVQIRTTLARFNSIEEQLQKLTEKTRLERLKWFFKGPKSKGLLKKVESIKSALNLILNIIRLATEASARQQSNTVPSQVNQQHQILQQQNAPSASSSSSAPPLPPPPPPPPPNRFRKVVESIVQASRLAVERAQEENAANPTEKRRQYNSELQRWQSDSNDTATWLYHLVFSSGSWNPASGTATRRLEERSFAVTIEDYDSDASNQATASPQTVKGVPQNLPDQKPDSTSQVIVWNSQTEPSLVVDRLLQSWTYLNEAQIQASKASYPSGRNKSRESLMNGSKDDTQARSNTSDVYTSDTSSLSDDETEWDEIEPERYIPLPKRASPLPPPPKAKEIRGGAKPGAYTFPRRGSLSNLQFRPNPKGPRPTPFDPFDSRHDVAHPYSVDTRYEIPGRGYDAERPTGWPAGCPIERPFVPTDIAETRFTSPPLYHMPPPPPLPFYTAPPPTHSVPMFSPYNAMPPLQPSSAPPRPCSPALSDESFHTASPHLSPQPELNTPNEEAIFSKLETILLGRPISNWNEVDDTKFSRLENLIMNQLDTQREMDNQKETEESNALKSLTIAENEKFDRLEKLLLEQEEDQVRRQAESDAIWRTETAEWKAKVAKEAKEARELSEQEIATAMAAKRSAEEMLKYVKEQAAERAREQAEAKAVDKQAKVAEQQRKIDESYKKRIDAYEEKLAEFTRGWQEKSTVEDRSSAPVPLRTTRIIEGDRQIEVSEFSKGRLEPFIDIMSPIMPVNWMQAGLLNSNSLASRNQKRPHLEHTYHSSLNAISDMDESSRYSISASAQSLGETQPSQSVILLPSQLDRSSAKMSEMQTSLESCGVLTTFDALERGMNNALVRSEARNSELIRSTIFWEPPLLSLGSELLGTLRVKGWKPFYIRKSDAGQTYFLGHQPIHVHFFKPDYQPQFKESPIYSNSEYIIIAKDLVEEYALLELGFQFNPTDAGAYTLDCRLTAGDIEALIDRSFMIRETNYRRLHRQLQWAPQATYTNPPPPEDDDYAPSLTSETTTSTSSRDGDSHDRETVYEDDTPIASPTNDSRVRETSSASEVGDLKLYESESPEEDRDKLFSAISTGLKKRRQLRLGAARVEDPNVTSG